MAPVVLGFLSGAGVLAFATPAEAVPTATVVVDPDAYTCDQRGSVGFEEFPDQTDLSRTVAGLALSTKDGSPWRVADFATGAYDGKYPAGGYTSQGTHGARLGADQPAGRITFTKGPASTVSVLVDTMESGVVLEGYDADGNLLQTAGPAEPTYGTGAMSELELRRDSADLASVLVRHGGSLLVVDALCTDGPKVPTSSLGYVALGDSYSSGEGVRPFFEPGSCHRSTAAFPTQVLLPGTDTTWFSRRSTQGYAFGLLACSGATTGDVRTAQIEKPRKKGNDNYLKLGRSTRLVTITVGGDDARFSDVLSFCALGHTSCFDDAFGKQKRLDTWLTMRMKTLGPKLSATYRAIHAHAPHARIVVLGYPQLFPRTRAEQGCVYLKQRKVTVEGKTYSILFSHAEQNFLRKADEQINKTIKSATTDSKVAEFVPVAPAFVHHEVCGSGGEWVNHVSIMRIKKKPYFAAADKSFHPTAVGQAAYAALVDAQISPAGAG